MIYSEDIEAYYTVKARTEREAYILVCVNEMLHTLGLISEADYSTNYAKLSDNDVFKLF